MANWLDAVGEVLDNAVKPIRVFFRDDDAGWSNDRLYALLDEFARSGMPIDLAVIPEALDQVLADELLSRQQAQQLIGLHQHGYSHTNHEPIGRKCEFGSSRSKSQQKTDIAMGQKRLHEALGSVLDPIFTPPWNRCTRDTVACLEELNFCLLSRDVTASELESATLQQRPVHINWSRMLDIPLSELGLAIADNLKSSDYTGIMLHHADMGKEHLKPLAELLALFADHSNAHGLLLRESLG
jgi:hypothetical protein